MKTNNVAMKMEARLVEAILFIENEALTLDRIREISNLSDDQINVALKEIKEIYDDSFHGIVLKYDDQSSTYSFTPSSDLFDRLRQYYGKRVDKRLSKAALETLSIVAYKQPITRKEIDNIRGVFSSDTIIRLLREREYIKVVGRKNEPGHPCLYGTSRKFLYEFNLQSISDLPKLSEIDKLRFDKEGEDND